MACERKFIVTRHKYPPSLPFYPFSSFKQNKVAFKKWTNVFFWTNVQLDAFGQIVDKTLQWKLIDMSESKWLTGHLNFNQKTENACSIVHLCGAYVRFERRNI